LSNTCQTGGSMSLEDLIITTYCSIEEMYQEAVKETKLRHRGTAPSLSDEEVLTMLVVGEYLGLGSDKKIWSYFTQHWSEWFPKIGCRTSFTRQSANLINVLSKMQQILSEKLCDHTDLYLFDGFPIPICHIKRYKWTSPFKGLGGVGYCAAKDQKYFGFKGHLLVSSEGVAKALSIAPADRDERDILPEVVSGLTGDVIADKGLIRPTLQLELESQGLILHTPLRKNMEDSRPKEFLSQIMNVRRKIETVVGQLVERFKIQSIRAKDTWHLMMKVGRKVFAHTLCFLINQSVNSESPLQLEKLLA
jgi:hypothetical protein